MMNLFEVSREIANRLTRIFLRDETGRRPVYGGTEKFQTDPHWKDYILFYEYFHGDNGAGLGASHQTGWTGLVAKMIEIFGRIDGEQLLEAGKKARLPRKNRRSATHERSGLNIQPSTKSTPGSGFRISAGNPGAGRLELACPRRNGTPSPNSASMPCG